MGNSVSDRRYSAGGNTPACGKRLQPLEQVFSDGGCLRHQSSHFSGNEHLRTYIKIAQGLMRLSDIDRSQNIRCCYPFEPAWYENPYFKTFESFWGRSRSRPTSGFIGCEASDGSGAIGIGYRHAMHLLQNSDDEHHCLHSGPLFGTLKPGEKRTRRGVILFGRTVEELFSRFETLGYPPDSTPPEK